MFKFYFQNKIIMDFYSKLLFRKLKLKLNEYINMKRNKQKLIKHFSNKFGNKEDVIVCFCDFKRKTYEI